MFSAPPFGGGSKQHWPSLIKDSTREKMVNISTRVGFECRFAHQAAWTFTSGFVNSTLSLAATCSGARVGTVALTAPRKLSR